MKKTAIFFPGQGPQYPGMGKMFYERSEAIKEIYAQASEVLQYDLARHSFEGSIDGITDTRYAQPAIVVAGYAAYRDYLEHIGPVGLPSFMAGHSMGEITALLCAGALNFSDAVRLAVKRGELMNRVAQDRGGAMAAIKDLFWKDTETICAQIPAEEGHVSVAAYNSDWQTVITGSAKAVEAAGLLCAGEGGIYMPLNIAVASHCPFMQDILAEFGEFVNSLGIQWPSTIVYSCMTGQQYRSVTEIRENITGQLVHPVLWHKILKDIKRKDAGIYIEAGPGSALGKIIGGSEEIVISLEKWPVDKIRTTLGQQVRFIPTPVTKCLSLMISIPDRHDNPETYEDHFLQNYRKVQAIQDAIEAGERLPDIQEMQTAVKLMNEACIAKGTPPQVMEALIRELLKEFPYAIDFFQSYPLRSNLQYEEIV
jgi:[acyl-carrier-protein] S-malonyltransferase